MFDKIRKTIKAFFECEHPPEQAEYIEHFYNQGTTYFCKCCKKEYFTESDW